MRFYGLSHQQALDLPIETFWMMHRNVDRLRAEEDYRMATIAIYAASGEKIEELLRDLRDQMGTIIEVDEGKAAMIKAREDRNLEGLKAISKMNKGV